MNFLRGLFNRKQLKTPFDIGQLQTDIHSHLIPGIDDGSQSMDQTIGMLLKFEALGYKKVITTPHIMSDYYKNTPEIINNGLSAVRAVIKEHKINIEIEAAAEYYYDEFLLDKVKNHEVMSFGSEKYVLFEFSFTTAPKETGTLLFTLNTNGYQPVIAHFERYPYFFDNTQEVIAEFKRQGAKIQVNINSLTGHYGPQVRKQAEMLIDNKWVDFIGTDCHRIEHLHLLESSLKLPYMHKIGELDLLNKTL